VLVHVVMFLVCLDRNSFLGVLLCVIVLLCVLLCWFMGSYSIQSRSSFCLYPVKVLLCLLHCAGYFFNAEHLILHFFWFHQLILTGFFKTFKFDLHLIIRATV